MENNDLRPSNWDDYIGQERIKNELRVRATAASERGEPVDHMLFYGPPGAGKTSLAKVVADFVGDEFESLIMPVTPRVLANTVRYHDGVLALDEVHRLTKGDQHVLLTLIEDGYIQTTAGRRFEAGWLTVIAITTEPQAIIRPLRERFVPVKWGDYTLTELELIVEGMARRLDVHMDSDTTKGLAVASGGVPRQAGHLVQAYADLTLTKDGFHPTVDEVLHLVRIEVDGLTEDHVRYLTTLRDLGCVKGEKTLSTVLNVEPRELQYIETVLVKRGFVEYGDRGRELTRMGLDRVKQAVMT